MIPRSVTVLSVAVSLLVCPLPCLSHSARSAAEIRSCCPCGEDACRRDSAPGSDGQAPGEPDSPPGTGMCLCHGAVTGRPAAAPAPAAWIVLSLPLDEAESAGRPAHPENQLRAEPAASLSCPAESGRHLRAHIASLLL